MHTNGLYAQKISDLSDLLVARPATVKRSLCHARAYRMALSVCRSALWGGAQAGAVSFRLGMIAAWRHAVKIFTGYGWLRCESYLKAVIRRKLCPGKGSSGTVGVSVTTDNRRGAASGDSGNRVLRAEPDRHARTFSKSALVGLSERSRADRVDCIGLCSGDRAGTLRSGGVSPRASPLRRIQGPVVLATKSLIGS